MAVTAQTIFNGVCFDLAEDPPIGPILGIWTTAQFIDLLNLTILEFLKRSGILQRVYTQPVVASQSLYFYPDDLVEIQSVWLAGVWLPHSTQRELNNTLRLWQVNSAIPKYFYLDGIPLKGIGLAAIPNYSSPTFVGGPVYDSFSALCVTGSGNVVLNPAQHRGLSIVGTQKATTQITALNQNIPLVPDQFALTALGFGVLGRLFSGDNELKDTQRAAFCNAQFNEQVAICQAISCEPGGEEEDR